jgi:uncharacterized protein YkwD
MTSRRSILLASGFALVLPASEAWAARKAAAGAASSADASEAVALVSRYRSGEGLGPVALDETMNAAARIQAQAVARLGRLDHGDFAGRVRRLGLRGVMAENLDQGPRVVAGAIQRWQASAPHRRNLLLPGATRMGLARADGKETRYWAMVIG